MCLTIRLPVSRPLVSALASAFLSSPRRNSADLAGHRARETPNCFPINTSSAIAPYLTPSRFFLSHSIRALTLRSTSGSASVSPHGNGLLVIDDVGEKRLRTLQFPAIDGLGGLPCVLKAYTKIGTAGAGALRWMNLRRGVSNHCRRTQGMLDLDCWRFGLFGSVNWKSARKRR
jgi:hypothetical protein